MKSAVLVIPLILSISTIAHADVVLKCQWIVKTNITKEKSKKDKKETLRFKKELFSSSPTGCVKFEYNNYGVPELTKEKWAELSEAYERPAELHLKCPEGYSPAGEVSWGLITGITRQHFYEAFHLDSYAAELPCVRDVLSRI